MTLKGVGFIPTQAIDFARIGHVRSGRPVRRRPSDQNSAGVGRRTSFATNPRPGVHIRPSNRTPPRNRVAWHGHTNVAQAEADRSSLASRVESGRERPAQTELRRTRQKRHRHLDEGRHRWLDRTGRCVDANAQKQGSCTRSSSAPGGRERAAQASSRCSMPFFETFASVMSLGIQSGLSLGAVSCQAHAS